MSGFFSLNNFHTEMRILNPINNEILKKFTAVRNHAVKCLKKLDEKTLELIMLQLVQALRYESIHTDESFNKN